MGEGDLDRLILISPSFKKFKRPIERRQPFHNCAIPAVLPYFFIFFGVQGRAALTNWGKLDCATSPSALADRPTEN